MKKKEDTSGYILILLWMKMGQIHLKNFEKVEKFFGEGEPNFDQMNIKRRVLSNYIIEMKFWHFWNFFSFAFLSITRKDSN